MQRIKDNYNIRLKVKRTMEQKKGGGGGASCWKDEENLMLSSTNIELGALVLETMTFLGMAQNADRLLNLLVQAKVTTLEQLEHLDRATCEAKQLPFDLICAIQNRYKVWALEMVDDAELGLEAGEKFYNIGLEVNEKNTPQLENGDAMPKTLNGDSKQIPGLMITPRSTEGEEYMVKDCPTPSKRPKSACLVPVPVYTSDRGEHTFSADMVKDTVAETMTRVMEQYEQKLWEKIEYAIEGSARAVMERMDKAVENVGRHVADCDTTLRFGLQDVSKSMERSQALMESKLEFVFATQKSQQTDDLHSNVKAQFRELSEKTSQSTSVFEEKVMSALASRFDSIEADTKATSENLSHLQDLHKKDVALLGGSLTELTEGCAHQVIQESKAAAYTIQAKMSILEEQQKKANYESEERMANKMQQFEKVVSEKVKDAISGSQWGNSAPPTMQSLPDHVNMGNFSDRHGFVDPDVSLKTLEALRSLEGNLVELIKGSTSDQSKQLELGLGVFGSALRAQLDSMQQSQAGMHKETEAKIDSKLDRIHEQGRKQTDKIITQLTLQQASGLQGPISSSFKQSSGDSSNGRRRSNNPWNEV
jgi:hypothetical protein